MRDEKGGRYKTTTEKGLGKDLKEATKHSKEVNLKEELSVAIKEDLKNKQTPP